MGDFAIQATAVPSARIPIPGTREGDRVRDQFESAMLRITGAASSLWMPRTGDTTTSTDRSRHADTWTYDATVAARFETRGSGWALDFNGTSHEADTSDDAIFSFGDGAVDQGFSVGALIEPDVNNALMTVIAKEASASAEEWALEIDASGYPQLVLTDESAMATIGRQDATAIGTSWVLLVATYDGSGASTGINVYVDAAVLDDTDVNAGTYTAMENTAALPQIGCHYTTQAQFYNGSIAFTFVTGKVLDIDDVWAMKALCNSYYDLAL